MYLLISFFIIASKALADAFRDTGRKTIGGLLETFYAGIVIILAFLGLADIQIFNVPYIPFWKILGGFLLLRYALFNPIYNLTRGDVPIFYIGTTKLFDKALRWFFGWSHFPSEHTFFLTGLVSLGVSIAWLLNYKQ